jgi:hypothetical protein
VNQASIFQYRQTFKELLREHLHELCAEALELVLLDEFVQVGRETFEDEAEVAFVRERLEHAKDVVSVARVVLLIQLQVDQPGYQTLKEGDIRDRV